MIKDNPKVAGSNGPGYPGQRRGTLRLLMLSMVGAVLAVGIAATICYGDEQRHTDTPSLDEATSPQTECPVMIGNKIDPDIYTDYKGKRVFFCCQSCKSAFAKNPDKYLPRLPQFASGQAGASLDGDGHGDHAHGFSLRGLAEPTGILTLSFVALTVCLGLLRRVKRLKPRLLLKLHKTAGICALCLGAIHATIVLLIH